MKVSDQPHAPGNLRPGNTDVHWIEGLVVARASEDILDQRKISCSGRIQAPDIDVAAVFINPIPDRCCV